MKVKELRDILSLYPDDMEVIIQKDSEGNDYSPLYFCYDDQYVYIAENKYSGTVISRCAIYDEYDFDSAKEFKEYLNTGVECCVLVPIN
jgi:hypothetical protein